jgi:hypothetical protein
MLITHGSMNYASDGSLDNRAPRESSHLIRSAAKHFKNHLDRLDFTTDQRIVALDERRQRYDTRVRWVHSANRVHQRCVVDMQLGTGGYSGRGTRWTGLTPERHKPFINPVFRR